VLYAIPDLFLIPSVWGGDLGSQLVGVSGTPEYLV